MAAASSSSILAPLLFGIGPPTHDPVPLKGAKEEETKEIASSQASPLTTLAAIVHRAVEASEREFRAMAASSVPGSMSPFSVHARMLADSLSAMCLKFDPDELNKICLFVYKQRPFYLLQSSKQNKNIYVAPTTDNSRAVQFNMDGSVFIHFNRKKMGDLSIGKTNTKSISVAIQFDTGGLFASAGINNQMSIPPIGIKKKSLQYVKNGDLELRGMNLTKNIPGFIRGMYPVSYQSKKRLEKVRIILPWYRSGTLMDNIYHLTFKQRIDIARQLLNSLVSLHTNGLIHRDLKETNIFLTIIGKKIEMVIGDLVTICIHEEVLAKQHTTTSWYASPEYAKAILTETCVSNATNEKLDIWSMGCILFALLYPDSLMELPGRDSKEEATVFARIAELHDEWLPKTLQANLRVLSPSRLDLLICCMLQVDPKRRIGPEELAKEIQLL